MVIASNLAVSLAGNYETTKLLIKHYKQAFLSLYTCLAHMQSQKPFFNSKAIPRLQ